jgi:hypothetical protein
MFSTSPLSTFKVRIRASAPNVFPLVLYNPLAVINPAAPPVCMKALSLIKKDLTGKLFSGRTRRRKI